MSQLETLIAAGAYLNAGHLDVYDGVSHKRLGEVTVAGDVVLSAAGYAFEASIVVPETPKQAKAREKAEAAARAEAEADEAARAAVDQGDGA